MKHMLKMYPLAPQYDPMPVELKDGEIILSQADWFEGTFIFQCPECYVQGMATWGNLCETGVPECHHEDAGNIVEMTFVGLSLCEKIPVEHYLKALAHRAEGDLKQAIERAVESEGSDQVDAIKVASDCAAEKGE